MRLRVREPIRGTRPARRRSQVISTLTWYLASTRSGQVEFGAAQAAAKGTRSACGILVCFLQGMRGKASKLLADLLPHESAPQATTIGPGTTPAARSMPLRSHAPQSVIRRCSMELKRGITRSDLGHRYGIFYHHDHCLIGPQEGILLHFYSAPRTCAQRVPFGCNTTTNAAVSRTGASSWSVLAVAGPLGAIIA